MIFTASPFWPLTITSFINRCGTIALSLVPILLVTRQTSEGDATIIMTLVKSGLIAGTLLGGIVTDYLNPRAAVLLSFIITALGFAGVPFVSSIWIITSFLFFATVGQGMFPSASRLLLTRMVPKPEQQTAIGWIRMANNAGLIVSYMVGVFLSKIGIVWLIFFDGMTSFLASVIGMKIIPPLEKELPPSAVVCEKSVFDRLDWKLVIAVTLMIGAFNILYDLAMTGTAALIGKYYGSSSVKYFSIMMLLNAILCSVFAVPASKFLKNPNVAFGFGMSFLTLGSLMMFAMINRLEWVFVGAFFLTLGEIFFFAMAAFILVRITPEHGKKGSFYGALMVMQMVAKTLGSSLAFSLVVLRPYGVACSILLLVLFFISQMTVFRKLKAVVTGQ